MGQNKQELVHLLNFVKQIYSNPDNGEFIAGIQGMVLDGDFNVKKDISEIRENLQMRGQQSIDYSFVRDEVVRNQLRVDNIRMENAALNMSMSDTERFNSFCINAFLQVENLVNYYFREYYDNDLEAVCSEIESATAKDKYPFERKSYMKKLGDIPAEKKILTFCRLFFPFDPKIKLYDYTYSKLDMLRQIRNDNFHRGGGDEPVPEKKDGYRTESEYRETLRSFCDKVRENLASKGR